MLSPAEQSASEPAEQQTIQRGLAAAKELGAVAHASAADAHALKSEIHANNNYAGANPYQVAPAAAAELERMTVALNAKMNVITNEVDTLISPPARVRTVYGGAHAVERGSLRPPPAPPPPKVYSVNAPCRAAAMPATSVNRSAAAGGDTGADVSGGVVSGASRPSSTVKVLRHRRDLRCASCYASLGLASVPIDSSRDSSRGLLRTPQLSDTSLLKEGSPSAPRRFEDGAFVRDGLTPGQRALGATGSDQHTSIRELVSRYGKPVMRPSERPPMGRDKRRFAASQKAGGVLDASKQVEAARRRADETSLAMCLRRATTTRSVGDLKAEGDKSTCRGTDGCHCFPFHAVIIGFAYRNPFKTGRKTKIRNVQVPNRFAGPDRHRQLIGGLAPTGVVIVSG